MRELKSAYDLACKRAIKPRFDPVMEEPTAFEFVTDTTYPETKAETDNKGDIEMQEPQTIQYREKPLEVHWEGNVLDYGGFGRVNRAFIFGLSNRNVMVKVGIQDYHRNVNEATTKLLTEMKRTPVSPKAPKVFGASMPMDMSHGGKKIIFTMIETSESIHRDYSEKLNLFDEIWVPTEHGKELLLKNNVCSPIYVIPLGVDFDRYKVDAKPLKLKNRLKDFRFISVFKWSYRKGPDLLLRSYLEEFSADDNVSLLMVTRALNVPEEVGFQQIRDDFEAVKSSIDKKEEDLPHVALYPDLIPERKMPSMYKACDAFVLLSRGEGFGLPFCFIKNTPIKTQSGYKNIQDIKEGEVVLTDKGRYQSVTDIHKNKVNCEFSNITCMLNCDFSVTSNHAFKSIKKPDKKEYKNKRMLLSDYLSKTEPQWIRAKDLCVNDYLVHPLRKEWGEKQADMDVMDFVEEDKVVKTDGGKVYSRFSSGIITNKDIAKIAKVSERQVGHFKYDGKLNSDAQGEIEKALKEIPIEKQKSCVSRFTEFDENYAKLLGYYCAEGNLLSNESGIEFHFHSNEASYYTEVCDLINKCHGLTASVTFRTDKKVATVYVCNSILAKVYKNLCGNHAKNKKIPFQILMSPQKVIWSFLNGYINGDGHSSHSANIVTITTASEKMAAEYQSLMLDHGEVCTLNKDKRGLYNCTIGGHPKVDFIDKDLRHQCKSKRWNIWSDDKHIYIPIIDMVREVKSETVFNFDVKEDHSYIAGIVSAHNCEASACGLPVIGTSCTGQTDFLTPENSFLVDPQEYAISSLNSVGSFSKMAKMSHFYEDQFFPIFGEESIGQAKRHMRYIYENKEAAKQKNELLRKDIIRKYKWEDSIDKAYNRILESQ